MFNIKHVYITDETRMEYIGLKNSDDREVWFIKYNDDQNLYYPPYKDKDPYQDGSIVAAIDYNNNFIVLDEFRNIITRFNRKEKLKRINESR